MGSVCCVAAKDRTLENRSSSQTLHSNTRYSPSWSFQWDNRGRVAGELDNLTVQFSHGIGRNFHPKIKGRMDLGIGDVSDGEIQLDNFQTPMLHKSPANERTAGDLRAPTTDLSMESSFSTEAKDLKESVAFTDPSTSKFSSSVPSPSPFSTPKTDPTSSQGHSLAAESTPSRWARCSPGHQLLRQVSDSRLPGLKSPNNNSMSEGRPSFVLSMCSNDFAMGSHGGSSDGWSMRTFSELVASSQRERWSFDSESVGSGHTKVTRSSSRPLASPSIDLQACGVCSKLLTEKSSWSSQKIISNNELSVVAVLMCGHVYHAECLENITPEVDRYDPACPMCMGADSQVLKMYRKGLRTEVDPKSRGSKISRNRVVDSDLDGDSSVFDHSKHSRQEGKAPKMGPSSSLRSSLTRPFLRRHFSLGSKSTRTLAEKDSSRRKGFWTRYRKD